MQNRIRDERDLTAHQSGICKQQLQTQQQQQKPMASKRLQAGEEEEQHVNNNPSPIPATQFPTTKLSVTAIIYSGTMRPLTGDVILADAFYQLCFFYEYSSLHINQTVEQQL